MKILILSTKTITFEQFLQPLIHEIEGSEKFSEVCLASSCDFREFSFIKKHTKTKYTCLKIRSLKSGVLWPVNLLLDLIELARFIRGGRFDIIFTHTPLISHLARLVIFFFRPASRPRVVYFVHGFRFTNASNSFKSYLFRLLEKFFASLTDRFILINNEDYEYAKKHFGEGRCFFIDGVGVDSSFSHMKLKREFSLPVNILVVAAYKDEKGYREIIKLADWAHNNKLMVRFNCYGYGDREKYQKIIDKKQLENICIHNFTNNLMRAYSEHNVFLSCSKREGLPVSIMEAMCVGMVVIASNIRGHNDLVQDSHNGFLYRVKDEQDLISVFGKVYELFLEKDLLPNEELQKVSFNGAQTCGARFSRVKLAKQTLNLLY